MIQGILLRNTEHVAVWADSPAELQNLVNAECAKVTPGKAERRLLLITRLMDNAVLITFAQ